jgi:succinylglutamate desuccinylase
VIVLAGIHGNEPAGLIAAQRVLESLTSRGTALTGTLSVLVGNRDALRRGRRFLQRDLNRQWTAERVAALLDTDGASVADEDREQLELLAALEGEIAGAGTRPIHFIDLHTSSADGPPFLTIGDTVRNRRFARRLPLPLLLGLEEQVDGSLLEYLNDRGLVTLGVEAGQHDRPSSAQCHEAVLWLALIAAGVVQAQDVPDIDARRALLEEAARDVPRVMEVRYRHPLAVGDDFRMVPGFRNFQPVTRGEAVAQDGRGDVSVKQDGLMLLPLYQGLGDDGFFIARRVRPLWLRLSTLMRRLHLDRVVAWLPGVRVHRTRRDVLVIDTRVARLYPLEVFHLCGYRKIRQHGSVLLVSRRRFDLVAPARIQLRDA